MMSGFMSSVASPARATATSTPAGFAPFTAMWNGMLARVGSVGPVDATISRPGTAPIMDSCCWRRYRSEAHPEGLGQAAPAVAGRDRPAPDDAGSAASDSPDPPRPASRREGRRRAGLGTSPAAGDGGGAGGAP